MADVHHTAASLPADTDSANPTSEFTVNDVRLIIGISADDATEASLQSFVVKHNPGDKTENDATTEKTSKLTEESDFRGELEPILTSASWDPSVHVVYQTADGQVIQIPLSGLSQTVEDTAKGWREIAANSLVDWRMPSKRASNLSGSMYKKYVKDNGSLSFEDCYDKMHRYAGGGARQTARASLTSEAKHTMPRSRAVKEREESVQSANEVDQSDAESDAE